MTDRNRALELYGEDARRRVDAAIRAGKVLPADREAAEERARTEPIAFEAEVTLAPPVVPLGELGSDEDAPDPPIVTPQTYAQMPDAERPRELERAAGELRDGTARLFGLNSREYRWARQFYDRTLERAQAMRRRLRQGLTLSSKSGSSRPRGRPPGPQMPRDVFLREMKRTVATLRQNHQRVTQKSVAAALEIPIDTFRDYLQEEDWPPR